MLFALGIGVKNYKWATRKTPTGRISHLAYSQLFNGQIRDEF
jgi:hypothetical protein